MLPAAVFPCLMSMPSLMVGVLLAWGAGIAVSNSLFVVLLIDVVGIDKYESGIAGTCLLLAFVSLPLGPAIGRLQMQQVIFGTTQTAHHTPNIWYHSFIHVQLSLCCKINCKITSGAMPVLHCTNDRTQLKYVH